MTFNEKVETWLERALAKAEKLFGFTTVLQDFIEPEERSVMAAVRRPPGNVTGLRVVGSTPTTVALSWKKPLTGTGPIRFTVFMRVHGASYWNIGAFSGDPFVTVRGLNPGTLYDFEILAHNN